jgi:hypothetical protein
MLCRASMLELSVNQHLPAACGQHRRQMLQSRWAQLTPCALLAMAIT